MIVFIKPGKKIVAMLFIGAIQACGQSNAVIDQSSSEQPSQVSPSKSGPDYFALVAGPTVKLYSPTTSPNKITTPTLLISGGGMKKNSYVYVYKKSNCTTLAKSAKAAGTNIKIKLGALTNGSYKFSAKVKTGTTFSACKAASAFYIVDTIAPSAPVVTSPTGGSTVSSTPTIAGTCETGAKVYVTGDLASVPAPATCAASAYSIPVTLSAGDGSKNLSIKQIDKAGNISPITSLNLVKDTSLVTVAINQAGGQADPTNNQVVSFQVIFGKAIYPGSFTAADITQSGTATGVVWSAPTTSDNITWTIQTSAVGGDGTVIPTINAGLISDPVGNLNSASSSSDNSVTFDTAPPSISVGAPSSTLIKTGFITYDLNYSNASSINLTSGDVTVNSSGTVTYSLSVSNGTTSNPKISLHITGGDGTVDSIDIAAGTSHDAAGNLDTGKSENTTITVDSTAVTVSINSPSVNIINAGAVDYDVEYAGGTSINLTSGDITVVATGTVVYNVSVDDGTTATPTIHVNVTGGDGIIDSISIAAGTSTNGITSDIGASEGSDVTIDNTNPTISINETMTVINNGNKTSYTFSGSCSEDGKNVNITAPSSVSGSNVVCSSGVFSFSGLNVSAESDGTVSFIVQTSDAAGNSNNDSANATKDVVIPTMSIDSPSSTLIRTGDITYNVTYSGADTINLAANNVSVNQNGTVNYSVAVSNGTTSNPTVTITINSGDGVIDSIAIASGASTDNAGNADAGNSEGTDISVDNTAPVVTINSPSFINNGNKTNYEISGTCSENGQDVNITAPAALVGNHVNCSSNTFSFSSLDVSGQADGTVGFTVQTTDTAGNSGSGSANATKDTVNPTVAINAVVYINNANKTSFSFTGTCSENGRSVNITAPTSVSGTTTCASGAFSFSGKDFSSEADGTVTISVSTTDVAGNSGSGSRNATKDTVAPTVTINSLSYINNANKAAYSISGTCSADGDALSITAPAVVGTATCTSGIYTISSINMTSTPDGTVNFTIKNLDTAGNFVTANASATKDIVAPAITALTLSSPTTSPNNISTPAIRVAGTFPIGDSFHLYSDLTCTTSVSGSTAATSANAVVVTSDALLDGSYSFFAKGTDAAGNTTCGSTHSVAYTLDTIAPTVSINTLAVINIANKASYAFSGTCTQNGDTVAITAPSGVTGSTTCVSGAFSFSGKSMTAQADGTVGISVRASDAAGNAANASANAAKDTVAPTITIGTLASIVASNQNAYSISGTCTANSDAVSITAPAISGSATCTSGTYTIFNIDASGLAQGTVNFTLKIQDAVGNLTTANASTTKDTVAPTTPSCTTVGTDAMPTKSSTVTWTGSTDAVSGINHYEMAIGISSPADTVNWTSIGASVAPYQFTGLSPKLLFNTDYITYIRAVDNAGNISDYDTCDAWHLKNGYGNFTGTQSTATTNPTYLNQATAYALKYSADSYNAQYFTHSTSTNSHQITVKEAGNYLLSHTLPLYRVNGNNTSSVAAASSTIKVNGTAVDIGFASNSFTRGTSGSGTPVNSSNHMTVLLKNLAANDVITIETQNTAAATEPLAVPVGDNFSTYLEYIPDEVDIFMAKATQATTATSPTNLNQTSTLYYKWVESIKDNAYTHSDTTTPQNITITNQGDYLVSVNVPYTGAASNLKIQAAVYVNGSNLNNASYTEALNGFISNLNGQVTSSTTYTNVLYNVPAGATINVRVIRQGSTGTVTVPAGKSGTLYIQRLNTGADYYVATGTSPSNWNSASVTSIAWATDHVIDSSIYSHTLATAPITVQASGDYMVYVSGRIYSTSNYASPVMHLAVNGTTYPGATCSAAFSRTTRTATQSSSCDMEVMLQGLNANDQISLTTIKDTLSSTVTGQPPRITIRRISE